AVAALETLVQGFRDLHIRSFVSILVRVEGLEPPRLAAPEPKSGASASSATPAIPARTGQGGPPEIRGVLAKPAAAREGILASGAGPGRCPGPRDIYGQKILQAEVAKHRGQRVGQVVGDQPRAKAPGGGGVQPCGGGRGLERRQAARQQPG